MYVCGQCRTLNFAIAGVTRPSTLPTQYVVHFSSMIWLTRHGSAGSSAASTSVSTSSSSLPVPKPV